MMVKWTTWDLERLQTCHRIYTLNSHNVNFQNVTYSLISRNPRNRMFLVEISLLIIVFLSLMSQKWSLMQLPKKLTHALALRHVSTCGVSPSYSYSYSSFSFSFFICHLLNSGAFVRHIAPVSQVEWPTLA